MIAAILLAAAAVMAWPTWLLRHLCQPHPGTRAAHRLDLPAHQATVTRAATRGGPPWDLAPLPDARPAVHEANEPGWTLYADDTAWHDFTALQEVS